MAAPIINMKFKIKEVSIMLTKSIKALGCAALFVIGSVFQANAQIAEEFECVSVVSGKSYTPISGTTIPKSSFLSPPLFRPNLDEDPDDGYFRVNLPFQYEFNGTTYQRIWISVNGFITFDEPLNLPQDNPQALYLNNANSWQNNVIAPYWGDHYYRNIQDLVNGNQPGSIKYATVTVDLGNNETVDAFVVEWNNIQINDETVESSVGNFQVWLYESTDQNSNQGNVEFAYGQVGPVNPQVPGNTVITQGASVGIKGSNGDFINGLKFDPFGGTTPQLCSESKTTVSYTDQWQPSGGSDKRITFTANLIFRLEESWGDGDANLSKAPGQRHAQFFNQQNRYVTMADVREILISVATSDPLDSIRRREAYHADVNHNGRYYWRNNPPGSNPARTRIEIPIRSMFYNQDLPNEITSLNQIFYQANEYDAAMIIEYLNAELPVLPWIYDWKTDGRDNKVAQAQSIVFGEMNRRSDNMIEVPVYLTGDHDGAIAMRMDFNGKVLNVVSNQDVAVEFYQDRVVVAGEGEFSADDAIFTALVETNSQVEASNVVLNENSLSNLTAGTEDANDYTLTANVTPNPVVENASFKVNIPESGHYTLEVYDQSGSLVKTIANTQLAAGEYSFDWNGRSNMDMPIAQGLYIYRLSGSNGISVSNTLIIGQ